MNVPPPGLIALSPGGAAPTPAAEIVARVEAAATSGVRAVLLREPSYDDGPLLSLARDVRRVLTARAGDEPVWVGVHDRVHVAVSAAADGVHLGFRSLGVAVARAAVRDLGRELAVGLSTHAPDDPETWAEADYLFHGPVFDTPSKRDVPNPPPLVGPDGLVLAVERAPRPIIALGGLEPEHAELVRGAGCHGMAVLGGILGRHTPAEVSAAARRYVEAWQHAGSAA